MNSPSDNALFALNPNIAPTHHAITSLCIAVSGGIDSVVLLHWFAHHYPEPLALRAVHINHQLSPNAGHWQSFVEQLCKQWQIPCESHCVQVEEQGDGLEQAARMARYAVFEKNLKEGETLLVGQHQSDQAETLLFRLLRGAGIKGMGAMMPERRLGKGFLFRPLLDCPKADIQAYAQHHQLEWIDDESNNDEHFSRNFLRHRILPHLQARWPTALQQLSASAKHAQEAQSLLDDYAAEDLKRLDLRLEKRGCSILLKDLQTFSWPRQKLILRHWISQQGRSVPSAAQLSSIRQLLASKNDAQPVLQLGSLHHALQGSSGARNGNANDRTGGAYEIRRFNGRLYCLPLLNAQEINSSKPIYVEPNHSCTLPDGSQLCCVGFDGIAQLRVVYRQGGERAHPETRQHSQQLKKLFQEYQIEPWLRHYVPLIYNGDVLLAVGDYWLEMSARAQYADAHVQWSYPNDFVIDNFIEKNKTPYD